MGVSSHYYCGQEPIARQVIDPAEILLFLLDGHSCELILYDLLLHVSISADLNPHQRSFYLQETLSDTEAHHWC